MVNIIQLQRCPLTGLYVINHQAQRQMMPMEYIEYKVSYENNDYYMRLCPDLFGMLVKEDSFYSSTNYIQIEAELKEKLPFFFGGQSKINFIGLFNKTIHWNCPVPENNRHTNIKSFAEEVIKSGNYPKSRKERLHLILKEIADAQEYEGQEIPIIENFKYWTKFYLSNFKQVYPYLNELKSQGLIDIVHTSVNLTFKGMEYVESLNTLTTFQDTTNDTYQISLSFAGEDRPFVQQVAEILKSHGIKVFYDDYEKVNLWGRDLYQHLNDVYRNKCQYCITFISEHYARKLWTNHELKSAQARAFEENREYILPVRFDDTEISGLNRTVGYMDAKKETPQTIADAAIQKLGK